jgi:hypothetical protein
MFEFSMIDYIAGEIATERWRQDEQYGSQRDMSDGTGHPHWMLMRDYKQAYNTYALIANCTTWQDVLEEEVYEAFAETDPEKIEAELLQVAAVCVAWIEGIRHRSGKILKVSENTGIPFIGKGGESL